jgi:hypothetical protein
MSCAKSGVGSIVHFLPESGDRGEAAPENMMFTALASILLAAGQADASGNIGQDGVTASTESRLPERGAFEDELKFSAEGGMFRAIELHYPAEYRGLIDAIYAGIATNPQDQSARASTSKRLLDAFFKRRVRDLGNAPSPLLYAINTRQLALARRLARDDPTSCAEFTANLFVGRSDLPPAYAAEAASLLGAIVEAAKAGESAPPDPRRQSFADEDSGPFYDQLLQAGPPGQMHAALAAKAGEPGGTPEMQCRVGVAIYASIEKLPIEHAGNAAAFFLTQALDGSQ